MGASRLSAGTGEACLGLATQNRNTPAKPRLAKVGKIASGAVRGWVLTRSSISMQNNNAYGGGRNEGVPTTRTNSKTH